MAQIVILQGCDLEKSSLSVKVKTFFYQTPATYPLSTHVKFHQNPIAGFSVTVFQSLTKRWPGEEAKHRRNNLMGVDILQHKLRHEGGT